MPETGLPHSALAELPGVAGRAPRGNQPARLVRVDQGAGFTE